MPCRSPKRAAFQQLGWEQGYDIANNYLKNNPCGNVSGDQTRQTPVQETPEARNWAGTHTHDRKPKKMTNHLNQNLLNKRRYQDFGSQSNVHCILNLNSGAGEG
jgi:hypothetical protein